MAAAWAPRTAPRTADAVVLGAGIVGVAAAYHLVCRHGLKNVVVADPHPPLSRTSARSTECYRNFFETPALVAFMNDAIDGIEAHARACDNAFRLTRRGYLFASARGDSAARELSAAARAAADAGAGAVRVHAGSTRQPPGQGAYVASLPEPALAWPDGATDGFDLITCRATIAAHFPFLAPSANTVLHARRCGWLNAHLYGSYFLDEIRRAGAAVVPAHGVGVTLSHGRVTGVRLRYADGETGEVVVATNTVVNATGPHLQATQTALDPHGGDRQALHTRNDLHAKVSFRIPPGLVLDVPSPIDAVDPTPAGPATLADILGARAPMVIWNDPVMLAWSSEERAAMAEAAMAEATPPQQRALFQALLQELPSGLHFRPYGDNALLALWEFVHLNIPVPHPPPPDTTTFWDPSYAEIVQRGLAQLIPALAPAVGTIRNVVDGGYYCHSHDDHPLVGPHGPDGVFLCGGLRGVGIMGAEVTAALAAPPPPRQNACAPPVARSQHLWKGLWGGGERAWFQAAGSLLARHVTGAGLPKAYTQALHPKRLADRGKQLSAGPKGITSRF